MIIAYHLIWTAYGWWLPNDPRGSTSHEVRLDVLRELGELHFGRKEVQPAGKEVRQFHQEASKVLHYPQLKLELEARDACGHSFARVIEQRGLTCYACAIMPDHVHILIRKHRLHGEDMIGGFQVASRAGLIESGMRTAVHPTWTAGHGWIVFLVTPEEIQRTIRYIEQNPLKIGLPAQSWSFVKPYDGWPLHQQSEQIACG